MPRQKYVGNQTIACWPSSARWPSALHRFGAVYNSRCPKGGKHLPRCIVRLVTLRPCRKHLRRTSRIPRRRVGKNLGGRHIRPADIARAVLKAAMTGSQKAYFRGATGQVSLRMPCPSDSHFPFCPLVLAQLRAMVCHCGNPVDCVKMPIALQVHSASGSMNRCVRPCGLRESADLSITNSSANSPSAVPPDTAAADAQPCAQVVRTPDGKSRTRSLSTGLPPCAECILSCTDRAASSCGNLPVGVDSVYQYSSPYDRAPTRGGDRARNPPCKRSGSPDAPTVQRFLPNASVNLLCCTRWKHAFTSTSHFSACKTVCSTTEAGNADYVTGRNTLSTACATLKERGVVCGLLVYEGQHFFEGRLLYEQLNGSLCWNGATWKRLYYSLTQDAPSAVSGYTLEESSTDAAGRPSTETHGVTRSPESSTKTTLSSCTRTGHGNRTFIILHAVGNNELQSDTHTGPCATTPSLSLQRSSMDESQHSPTKDDAFKADGSGRRRRVSRAQGPSQGSAWSDRTTEIQSNSSGSDDSHTRQPGGSDDANASVSATSDSVSPAREPPKFTFLHQSSCSPALGDPVRATGRASHTHMPYASNGQRANTYTLSLVMQLGAPPYDMYVRLTEPIRLQPLILAAGVAKLSTAVLLMQRLYKGEQQKLQEQYRACMEALDKTTEEMAAATAQRQEREDNLLKGACVLLNEKKQKLVALRQRVVSLEKELENARWPGDSGATRWCGASQRRSCRAGELAVGDHAVVRHTSQLQFCGEVQNNIHNEVLTKSKTPPCRGLRTGSCAHRALAGGQTSTRRFSPAVSRRRAVNRSDTFAETRSSEQDSPKKRSFRDTDAAGLFLVRDKRLFAAAFGCIRVKEEPFRPYS